MITAALLYQRFLEDLKASLPSIIVVVGNAPNYLIRINAPSSEIPAIGIWFRDNDITVEFGELWHEHFDTWGGEESATQEDSIAYISREAVTAVNDIVSNKACFVATYKGGKLLSCSTHLGSRASAQISLDAEVWHHGTREASSESEQVLVYRWSGIEKQ